MDKHQHTAPAINEPHQHHVQHDHGDVYHDHHGMISDFRKRFLICLVITLPVLLLSHMIQQIIHLHISFPGDKYLLFALSSFIFFYGGWPFLKGLVSELKKKSPGMMTLIAIAITVAYVYSTAVAFGLKGMDFYWELATLIVIMLLGHWIEMRSVAGASRSLEMLVKLLPSTAHMLHGDHVMDVKISDLKNGDLVLVKPGEKIPADGEIVEGESDVNESMLTGESKPVHRQKDDRLIGGSVNGNGSLRLKISRTGKDAYLSKVISLVEEAQKTKSQTQKFADKAAFWLTIFALGGGLATLLVWLSMGKEFAFALERMVTVMVISCPHALGLAIPLVVAISTSLSARKGLLIRNRNAFENARKISIVVFDKTGTLTEGSFGVKRYQSFRSDISNDEILRVAFALESDSEHPIAQGVVQEAGKHFKKPDPISGFKAIRGKGVSAILNGKETMVTSPGFLKENNISLPEGFKAAGDETIVFVLIEKQLSGFIALADRVRKESLEAIELLRKNGIKTMMLTGDNKSVAQAVAKETGLDDYLAEVLPEQKLEKIKELQGKGEFVAMTGDGVNDAPALAQADVGIAVGSGTDVAAETADIILVRSNPMDIASLILFGRATYKKMVQNLVWATAYNAVTMPLATGFISGLVITPAAGGLFMSLSTIIVAINAQTLKRKF